MTLLMSYTRILNLAWESALTDFIEKATVFLMAVSTLFLLAMDKEQKIWGFSFENRLWGRLTGDLESRRFNFLRRP